MRIAYPRARKEQNECWYKTPPHSLNPRSFNVYGSFGSLQPKFNFRSNILSLLIARLADDDMETRVIILKQIDSILFDDHVSEIAVEIVRSVSKLVKNKKYLVPPDVLNCLLGIPLKADLKDKKIQMQARKKGKKKRKLNELEKNLENTSASINVNTRNSNQVIILKDLFNLYFRVLKRSVPSSPLIGSAMHGVAKFSPH